MQTGGNAGLPARRAVLLVLSSLANGALGAGAFLFGVFATSPDIADATMRLGFYVLNAIAITAAVGVVAPWVLALRGRVRAAALVAVLPAALAVLAVLAFLGLDSWIRRTYAG
jgi:hypothetical protein